MVSTLQPQHKSNTPNGYETKKNRTKQKFTGRGVYGCRGTCDGFGDHLIKLTNKIYSSRSNESKEV